MAEFEIKVTITLEGYESLSASSEEEAEARMEAILEDNFRFSAPLSQKSSSWKIEVNRRTHD